MPNKDVNPLLVNHANNMVLSCTPSVKKVSSMLVVASVNLNVPLDSEMMVCSVLSPLLMEEVLVIPGSLVMVSISMVPPPDVKEIILKVVNKMVWSFTPSVLQVSTMLDVASALLTVLLTLLISVFLALSLFTEEVLVTPSNTMTAPTRRL